MLNIENWYFQRLQHAEAAMMADLQTSEEWLNSHSIEYMKLTLKDLVDKGKVSGFVKYMTVYKLLWC